MESGPLAHLLLDDDGEGGGGGGGGSEEEKREAGVGGGRMVKAGTRVCPHCLNKLHVKFVDMLTYPRPVRKFEV